MKRPPMAFWIAAVSALGLAALLVSKQPSAPETAKRADAPSGEFIVRDVRVFDGERLLPKASVHVRDGLILAVADTLDVDGIDEVDGRGRTLLPGFIDAHVHAFLGARREALRFGVTAELDMFGEPSVLPAAKAERAGLDATDQADLWSAGMLATAPGGHGTQFGLEVPTLTRPEQAAAWVDARIAEGSDYIKLVREDLGAYRPEGARLPTLDAGTSAALIEAAHARDVLAVAHVSRIEHALEVLEAGVDGLVHVPQDFAGDIRFIELALQRRAFVVPTLSVVAAFSGRDNDLAGDPELDARLSSSQREALRGRPNFAPARARLLEAGLANVRALHAAGVPILAGTDAPNPGTAHGVSMHGELALLVEAGLTPVEALRAATSAPARAFALSDRGRIAPGLRADLVLVEGDPSVDIRDTRTLVQVWKNGHAVAPQVEAQDVQFLRAGTLADFDDEALPPQWMAASDRMRGGQSSARIRRIVPGAGQSAAALEVEVELAGPGTDGGQRWAGAFYSPGAQPMQAVDASALRTLQLEIRSEEAALDVLLFSGAPPQPARVPVSAALGWQTVTIDLQALAGFEPERFAGLSIAASGDAGPVRFAIDQVQVR